GLDEVAEGAHPRHATTVHHRKVTHAVLRDEPHGVLHAVVETAQDEIARHHLAHLDPVQLRAPVLTFAQHVPLRDDPRHAARGIQDEEGADAILHQAAHRVEDGVLGADGMDLGPLYLEDVAQSHNSSLPHSA